MNTSARFVICIAIFATLVSAFALHYHRGIQPLSSLTNAEEQGALQRAQELCRVVLPPGVNVNLVAQRNHHPLGFNTWSIVGKDAGTGRDVLHLEWDAVTGALNVVGYQPARRADKTRVPMNREELVRTSWKWLRDLGIAKQATRWIPSKVTSQSTGASTVQWYAGKWKVMVTLDSCSGDIVRFLNWRPQDRQAS